MCQLILPSYLYDSTFQTLPVSEKTEKCIIPCVLELSVTYIKLVSKWYFTSMPEANEIVNTTESTKEHSIFNINILI